jgi:hypothetical protein
MTVALTSQNPKFASPLLADRTGAASVPPDPPPSLCVDLSMTGGAA